MWFNANEELRRKIFLGCYVYQETQHGGVKVGEGRNDNDKM